MTEEDFPVWVIYDHPRDYPDHFVVRRQRAFANGVIAPDEKCQLAKTLAEARTKVPPGLYNIGRRPEDDPVIVECWI